MPITEPKRAKNHQKLNVEHLKNVFRKKHTLMPYKHEELKQLPMEAVAEGQKVDFDMEKLTPEEKAYYDYI